MAKESTPVKVTTNALQSLPIGSIIGNPLNASIGAQAEQAKKAWQFAEEVRLQSEKETKDKE